MSLIHYDAQGKAHMIGMRGVAITEATSDDATKTYTMVCYDPKTQKPDCQALITPAFSLIFQSESYVAFYDQHHRSWSMHISNPTSFTSLCQHVALVKHATAAACADTPNQNNDPHNNNQLMFQDIRMGVDDSADAARSLRMGDQVKLRYSIYLLSQTHPRGLGACVHEVQKLKPIKLGDNKVRHACE